jgi:hypothetical protein
MNKAAAEQTLIPGTEGPRKRQSMVDKAQPGDLLIALVGGKTDPALGNQRIAAIEQVTEGGTAAEVVARWKDQGVIDGLGSVEVWEARPGMYYRKRTGR